MKNNPQTINSILDEIEQSSIQQYLGPPEHNYDFIKEGIIPEVTVTPNGNYIKNTYDNIIFKSR